MVWENQLRNYAGANTYARLWEIINGLTACEVADLRREAQERVRGRRRRAK